MDVGSPVAWPADTFSESGDGIVDIEVALIFASLFSMVSVRSMVLA